MVSRLRHDALNVATCGKPLRQCHFGHVMLLHHCLSQWPACSTTFSTLCGGVPRSWSQHLMMPKIWCRKHCWPDGWPGARMRRSCRVFCGNRRRWRGAVRGGEVHVSAMRCSWALLLRQMMFTPTRWHPRWPHGSHPARAACDTSLCWRCMGWNLSKSAGCSGWPRQRSDSGLRHCGLRCWRRRRGCVPVCKVWRRALRCGDRMA